MLLSTLFCSLRNWGTESLVTLSKVAWLACDQAAFAHQFLCSSLSMWRSMCCHKYKMFILLSLPRHTFNSCRLYLYDWWCLPVPEVVWITVMKRSDMGKIQGSRDSNTKKFWKNRTFSPLTPLAFCLQRGLSLAGPGASLGFPHLLCDPVSSAHGSCEMSVPDLYFLEEQMKAPPSSTTGVCCPNIISEGFGIWTPESGLWAVKTQWRDKNPRDH